MGKIATPDGKPIFGTDLARRMMETMFGAALSQVCLSDDMNLACFHILQGSREGLAFLERRHEAMRRDLQALHIACEVAGRAAAQEKTRADQADTDLLQERKRADLAEAQLQSWMAI